MFYFQKLSADFLKCKGYVKSDIQYDKTHPILTLLEQFLNSFTHFQNMTL